MGSSFSSASSNLNAGEIVLAVGKTSAYIAGGLPTFVDQYELQRDSRSDVTSHDASVKVNDTWMTPSRNDGP